MTNPFFIKGSKECFSCDEKQFQQNEDEMFSHEGEFYCSGCANEMEIVCDCGNYKKPEYELCYECNYEK